MDNVAIELEALEHVFNDASAEPMKLSYGLLRSITEDFSHEIGRGGFGVVYMGYLGNGKVAVKKLSGSHVFSDKSFLDETKCLIRAKHKNVVRFLGYCSDTQGEVAKFDGAYVLSEIQERLLCFEYVPNGNIQHYLKEKPRGDDWHIRYRMIDGICRGLQYLHEERIGHLDLKPENVMLDSHMDPKITDFGLSRWLDVGKSIIVTANICGTRGYIAPETMMRGELSLKSDIYALGIIIIKLITRRDTIDFESWHESLNMDSLQMSSCIEIARECVEIDQANRPTICEIIHRLNEMSRTESSMNQESGRTFSGTELLDAYPLELRFPFEPNQSFIRSLALRNETDREVGFIIGSYFENEAWSSGTVRPMSSSITELTLVCPEELELCDHKVLISMILLKPGHDVEEIIQKAMDFSDGEKLWYTGLWEKVTESGGDMNWATLTIVMRGHVPPKIAPAFSQGRESDGSFDAIKSIGPHATKPWVLVQLRSGTVYVWDLRIRKKIWTKDGQAKSAIFISQHDWILIGDVYGFLSVYMCPYVDLVKKFKAHLGGTTSLAVHPTRPFLMSHGERDKGEPLKLWDWDKDWSCIQTLSEEVSPVKQLMFNPNDTNIFSALGLDGTLEMWELDSGNHINTPDAFEDAAMMDYLPPNSNNGYVITSSYDHQAHIWDLQKGTHLHSISVHITAIACHPTRPLLVIATVGGHIQVWDSTTYRLKKEYRTVCNDTIGIALIGSRRLLIATEEETSILEIDL